MAHAPHSFRAINVFIQHRRYEIVFVLHWELVAMCSGVQKITGVLWFGKQLPQNMTRVGHDGPEESLVCIAGQVSNGLSITRDVLPKKQMSKARVSFTTSALTGSNSTIHPP